MLQHASLPTETLPGDIHSPAHAGAHTINSQSSEVCNLDSITIRACSSSIYDKPLTIQPLLLIDRTRLPLAFLDPSNGPSLTSTRLFTGVITLLDDSDKNNASHTPKVMLVKTPGQPCLSAVEAVGNGVFALCRLAPWVRLEMFGEKRIQKRTIAAVEQAPPDKSGSQEWWAGCALKRRHEGRTREGQCIKRLKLSIMRPDAQPMPNAQVAEVCAETTPAETPGRNVEETVLQKEAIVGIEPLTAPNEVLETLVRQYLDALYLSKTSLAFFAKGPLSRARAAFITDDLGLTTIDPTTFLRSMILKVDLMSKRYRETLPELVKQVSALQHSEDETATRPKKKKKTRKPKVDKSGLYSFEDDFVRKWWHDTTSELESINDQETAEKRLKRRLAALQTRETLAQIILILEVLALEALASSSESAVVPGESQKAEDFVQEGAGKSKTKVTKPQDLHTLLELLMDKLSIWQSVESSIDFGIDDHDRQKRELTVRPVDRDALAAFCTEVVIPFYKARIPKQAALVIQKLAGSSRPRLEKRTSSKKTVTKSKDTQRKEGAPKEADRMRTLKKSTSDMQHMASRAVSLSRSVTDPSFIKREASELSMSAIPSSSARPRASREPSVQLRHLNRRQIDVNAIAAATDAKLKKKAMVESELRGAIDALKKPNRVAAVKEYADVVDLRKAGTQRPGLGRRTSSAIKAGVQVDATPKCTRTADFFSQPVFGSGPIHERVPLSTPVVPRSTVRKTARPQPVTKPFFTSWGSDTISATPSKGTDRMADFMARPGLFDQPSPLNEFPPRSVRPRLSSVVAQPNTRPSMAIPASYSQPVFSRNVDDSIAATPALDPGERLDYFATPTRVARPAPSFKESMERARSGATVTSEEAAISLKVTASSGSIDRSSPFVRPSPRTEAVIGKNDSIARVWDCEPISDDELQFSEPALRSARPLVQKDLPEAITGSDIYSALGWDD